jgi:hypothetical protein
LGDDREIGQAPNRLESGAEFLDIAEGLQDESVHPSVEQPPGLAGEVGLGFFPGGFAERFDSKAEGADRPDHRGPAGGHSASQLGGGPVDPLGLGREAILSEFARVGAEGVGLDDLGAGAEVFPVDGGDQVGLAEVQLVVADVEEDAALVEHGAHRPVEDVGPAVGEEGAQGHRS